jgi:hypothetical protein
VADGPAQGAQGRAGWAARLLLPRRLPRAALVAGPALALPWRQAPAPSSALPALPAACRKCAPTPPPRPPACACPLAPGEGSVRCSAEMRSCAAGGEGGKDKSKGKGEVKGEEGQQGEGEGADPEEKLLLEMAAVKDGMEKRWVDGWAAAGQGARVRRRPCCLPSATGSSRLRVLMAQRRRGDAGCGGAWWLFRCSERWRRGAGVCSTPLKDWARVVPERVRLVGAVGACSGRILSCSRFCLSRRSAAPTSHARSGATCWASARRCSPS